MEVKLRKRTSNMNTTSPKSEAPKFVGQWTRETVGEIWVTIRFLSSIAQVGVAPQLALDLLVMLVLFAMFAMLAPSALMVLMALLVLLAHSSHSIGAVGTPPIKGRWVVDEWLVTCSLCFCLVLCGGFCFVMLVDLLCCYCAPVTFRTFQTCSPHT